MKKLLFIAALIAIASVFAYSAKAQTTNQVPNYIPPSNWYEMLLNDAATSTNFVVLGGYGHSTTGSSRNLVFGEIGYNFNNYAGVVGGYDYLWGGGRHQFNSVKGGLALQAPFHPFGIQSVVLAPTVFDQVATSSSSTVANIVGAGLDAKLNLTPTLYLHVGPDFEKRTGDSNWDGQYALFHIAFSGNF